MKVSVDGVEIFTLNETRKKVIQDEVRKEDFEKEMKALLKMIIEHKYDRCFQRMKDEWEKKLVKDGVKTIPSCKDKFAEVVFKHKDYKNRSTKEKEAKEKREAAMAEKKKSEKNNK